MDDSYFLTQKNQEEKQKREDKNKIPTTAKIISETDKVTANELDEFFKEGKDIDGKKQDDNRKQKSSPRFTDFF